MIMNGTVWLTYGLFFFVCLIGLKFSVAGSCIGIFGGKLELEN